MDKETKYLRLISILSLIVVIFIYAPFIPKLTLKDLLNYRPESSELAAIALVGLYCLKAIAMVIPLVMLYVVAGIIFPPGWAIIITYFCLFIEMTISFFVGRCLGSKRVLALVNESERAKKLMEFGCNNGLLSCFVVRFIPGPPFDLTNMLIGSTGMKYHQFIAGTLLGVTPGMIPLVLMGDAAADPLSPQFMIPFSISMLTVLFVAVGYYVWRKKLRARIHDDLN